MTINEEARQLEDAVAIESKTRGLAHSTRDVPKPSDSYQMLGELSGAVDNLAQVLDQLATWHNRVEDGVHYDGEAGDLYGNAEAAGSQLKAAALALKDARANIDQAHQFNSVVRWRDTVHGKRAEQDG